MLRKSLVERAAAVLPGCRTLAEAEKELGGGMSHGDDQRRDWHATAWTWGLFDGFQDRPEAWDNKNHEAHTVDYYHAYTVGRRLAKDARKPCRA